MKRIRIKCVYSDESDLIIRNKVKRTYIHTNKVYNVN